MKRNTTVHCEPVSTGLEPFTVRLTLRRKERLKALAQVLHEPAYAVLSRGFDLLWDSLPGETRRGVDEIVRIVGRAGQRC